MTRRLVLLAAIVSSGLLGCAEEDPTAGFRTFAPVSSTKVAIQATQGILSGKVYSATAEATNDVTGLPQGYALLGDGESKLMIQVVSSSRSFQVPIASGAYQVSGLPLRVPLQVTAFKTGLLARMQTLTLPPSGRARLDFAYVGDASDSYLRPGTALAVPWELRFPKISKGK